MLSNINLHGKLTLPLLFLVYVSVETGKLVPSPHARVMTQAYVQEITKCDINIKAIIQDIRDCTGPLEQLNELNSYARELLQSIQKKLSELELLGREQDKETDKIAILKDVQQRRKQLERKQATQESVLNQASGITEDLMRVNRMMANTVGHSQETMSHLVSSSAQISETQEEFKSQSGVLQMSKKLLTKYGRREFTDKLLIFLALVFFFATVLYIMKRRLFHS